MSTDARQIAPASAREIGAESVRVLRLVADTWRRRDLSMSLATVAVLCCYIAWNMGGGVASAIAQGAGGTAGMLTDPGVLLLMWTKGGVGCILVVMTLSITRPFETGLGQLERLAVPRTWQWPLARWLVPAVGLGISTMLVSLLTWEVAHRAGIPQGIDPTRFAMAVRLSIGLVLISALVAGLATAVRSSAVMLSAFGLWFVIGEEILGMNPSTQNLAQFMPLANLWHFVGFTLTNTVTPSWSPMVSGALLGVAAVLSVGIGAWRSRSL